MILMHVPEEIGTPDIHTNKHIHPINIKGENTLLSL
jgi:hypothetical protein